MTIVQDSNIPTFSKNPKFLVSCSNLFRTKLEPALGKLTISDAQTELE